jgi:hypothetical protein
MNLNDKVLRLRDECSLFQYMAIGLYGRNGLTVSFIGAEWQIEHDLGHVTHHLRHMVELTV